MSGLAKWAAVGAVIALLGRAGVAEPPVSELATSAADLLRAVVINELNQHPGHDRWMYVVDKEQDGRRQRKEVVQTENGSLERLLAVDGHSLSPRQQQEETDRIKKLSGDPQELKNIEDSHSKDRELGETLLKMIPDALLFSYAGGWGEFIKLTFKPNPDYQPSSREARVIHAMEGEILLQASQKRLASIRGHLMEDVKFGGGLLGHLEKGGRFSAERTEISPGRWMLTAMEIDMKGKALFVKTISVQQKQYRGDFRKLPDDLTPKAAAELLVGYTLLASRR